MTVNQSLLRGALLGALAFGTMTAAHASDEGRLTVRVRAIYIDPADKSSAIPSLNAPSDAIDVQSKWAPDIDLEYALTDHWGLELLLTIPQQHDVTLKQSALGSNVDLGTVDHLPPTLTAKYYFATGPLRPYFGAGVNVTYFTDDDLLGGALDVDKTSFGPALQIGMDLYFNDSWSLSFDVKRVWIDTDVSLNGATLTTVDVDPWIAGLGVGYRFN